MAWFRYDLMSLFRHFEFPNLSSLEIEWSESYRDGDNALSPLEEDPDFPPAFFRSLSGLEKLKLVFLERYRRKRDPKPIDHLTSFPEILEASPSITDLEIIQEGSVRDKIDTFNTTYPFNHSRGQSYTRFSSKVVLPIHLSQFFSVFLLFSKRRNGRIRKVSI
ncbi:hypothetical protein E1B28_003520 [Marasmius oreades]|uniref:Uncharacterized protein n=1 Tax=Marasmius oreades TaxID=181124 RepID=A0A9P7UJZ6_9AGAR|nr:uncharacterized protein E1B28_003520 [Marasmius oreades]KAG7085997.1 hypothetical protein E1B28_003520 [Marasmius oreades]